MAFLLRLPLEILGRIIKKTIPEDFESFVVTCTAVYHASNFLRPKYNALKKRYRNFEYGVEFGEDEDSCNSSFDLLVRIAQEPLIARYIVSANFILDSAPTRVVTKAHIRKGKDYVLTLLENSSYLQSAGIDSSSFFQDIISHHPRPELQGLAETILLLTLLPNATHLALPHAWKYYWEKWRFYSYAIPQSKLLDLIDVLIARANDIEEPDAGLSKLTSILPSVAWGYDNRWDLSVFTPLLSINSVRSFIAGGCRAVDDGYTGAVFSEPKHASFGQSVESIELTGACVNDVELGKFLSHMPHLRSFKMSFETKWHRCCRDWDAGAVMAIIEEKSGHTLETLSFSILNCYGDSGTGVYSLKGFTRLKEVELGIDVLLGPQHGGVFHHRDRIDGSVLDSGPLEVPRLGDLLPATVETFCLVLDKLDSYNKALNWLFSNIAEERDVKLPLLKEIIIRNPIEGVLEGDLGSSRIRETEFDHGGGLEAGVDDSELRGDHEINPKDDAESTGEEEETHQTSENGLDGDEEIEESLDTQDSEHYDDDQGSFLPRIWEADLKTLGMSVDVKFVKAPEQDKFGFRFGMVYPSFMRGFCERYGVECI